MRRDVCLFLALATLAACAKPAPQADPCVIPAFAATAQPGTYMGEREAAAICVKRAAFTIARQGGPLPPIAAAAIAQCGAEEAAAVAALKKSGPAYDYQFKIIHDDLTHAAARAAIQARAIGCGRAPGQGADTVYGE
jgi:hypothetical protein